MAKLFRLHLNPLYNQETTKVAYNTWADLIQINFIITRSPHYPRPKWYTNTRGPHKMVLYCRSIICWIYTIWYQSACLSQPSCMKLWLLLPLLSSLFFPESSSPLFLPPMCSRSRHAACMPTGGSSQLRLLQVAEHLTLSGSAVLIS